MTRHTRVLASAIMATMFGTSAQAVPLAYVADPDHEAAELFDMANNMLIATFPVGEDAQVMYMENVTYGAAPGDDSITIDFDTFPDGTPVPEPTLLTNQYAELGAIFSIADTLFPPGVLIIEDVSDSADIFVGMSLPNILSFHGYSPGPHGGLGCNADLRIDFVDGDTQEPATMNAASIQVFARALTNTMVRLVARDVDGNIVDQDEITVPAALLYSFLFRVSGSANITSIETEGATGNDVCMGFDNLVVEASQIEIKIDIKPGSDPNPINPFSRGVIPVAILTTEDFDALTVDADSVLFGPDEAEKRHKQAHVEDVDGGDRHSAWRYRGVCHRSDLRRRAHHGLRLGEDSASGRVKCRRR
jgi:hypothetical protein